MPNLEVSATMRRAFKEVTESLIGLFDLYDVDPRLVQDTASALGRVFQAQFEQANLATGAGGNSAMRDLLKEIEAADSENPS